MAHLSISKYLWRGASITYGLVCLTVWGIMALRDGAVFRKPSKEEQEELSTARENIWALSKTPYGVKHQFFTLKDGRKLHYVVTGQANAGSSNSKSTALVVCLHGFPDSWVLWQGLLSSSLAHKCMLVAVDLPGHGGSDSLPNYGPDEVLEAITQFILGMRELYGVDAGSSDDHKRVLLVAHDWGSTIAFRLASEAPQLVNRFIIANSFHPPLALSNLKSRFTTAIQMFKTWIRQPLRLPLLRSALSTLGPVATQLKLSGYVFVFNLPAPLSTSFGALGNYWFLRLTHAIARGKRRAEGPEAAEHLASSLGPGVQQCQSQDGPPDDGYPASVQQRATEGGWRDKIALYRDGLATRPWRKSLDTIVALDGLDRWASKPSSGGTAGGVLDVGPPGALRAPTTVVWGLKDIAIDRRIALDGVAEYLAGGSQVLVLRKCGHWVPYDEVGKEVLEEVVRWGVEGEKGGVRERVEGWGVEVWVDK